MGARPFLAAIILLSFSPGLQAQVIPQFSTVEGVNNLATAQSHLQAADLLGKTVGATVTTNGVQSAVRGQVLGVRFDTSGVHLTLAGVQNPINLDQISQVTN